MALRDTFKRYDPKIGNLSSETISPLIRCIRSTFDLS